MLRINSGITTSSDIIHKVSKAVVTRIVMINIVFSPNNVSSNASTNLFWHNTSIEIATKINPAPEYYMVKIDNLCACSQL